MAPANEQVMDAVLASDQPFTPVGIAAALLWGRSVFGQEWSGFHTISKISLTKMP
jgi:hypothetical protein